MLGARFRRSVCELTFRSMCELTFRSMCELTFRSMCELALDLCAALAVLAATASPALAQPAKTPGYGPELLRLLGPRAADVFSAAGSRSSRGIAARVVLPRGTRANALGLSEIAPGFARLTGSPAALVAFADAHPDLRIEVTPPLHTLLNNASAYVFANEAVAQGLDGSGVAVGIADTGIDLTHPDFLDAQGHTRVAWLLDLSAPPRGVHPDLEKPFGATDTSGKLVAGAVWSSQDIDAALAAGSTSTMSSGSSQMAPQDEVGHGTLVASCAAGNGLSGKSPYRGIAPMATLLVARITAPERESIDTDDMLRGVSFLFDRADAIGKPVVVNLSLGTDFGPHDGTTAWEQSLASFVGPDHPGRALIAAAGNSGSISQTDGPLVHQSVYVSSHTTLHVPIPTNGAQDGGVAVWVAMHSGADMRVGLDGPSGTWIAPVGSGSSAGKNGAGYGAAVYNGTENDSPVPAQSRGAVVAWQGEWPAGTYAVTLSGSGSADLYVEALGNATGPGGQPLGFAEGVREGTVNLPATHPSIIGVGCTINKTSWRDVHQRRQSFQVPLLDSVGGMPNPDGLTRAPLEGEPCWFSSAGPTLTGVQKPEIMAPGAAIVGALSHLAMPSVPASIFSNALCVEQGDTGCQLIDSMHAVSFGTSFSSPIVAGAVAVLLQHDPTLTQGQILAALQGGAHPLRGAAPFSDQAGAGEVDVLGSLAAVDRARDPSLSLPLASESWMVLGADTYLADGSTPLQVVIELRAARAGTAAAVADGFADGRLAAYARVDGRTIDGAAPVVRRGPGVWTANVQFPAGFGGSTLTVGATFDGAPIVAEKSVPIATDTWNAVYPTTVAGGCEVARAQTSRAATLLGLWLAGAVVYGRKRCRGARDRE